MIALCLALVLDVSGSITPENYVLQRDATAAALETPDVARAARDGMTVSVIYFETDATVVVAPQRNPVQAASALRAIERPSGMFTSVAAGIQAALDVVLAQDCERRVIDVSGDGKHNSGPLAEVTAQVERAADAEVQINALPIITRPEDNLAEWFDEHVARPTGGFVLAASWGEFTRAIRRKIASEVASR
jgi:Ca-activated chloride channel family protein